MHTWTLVVRERTALLIQLAGQRVAFIGLAVDASGTETAAEVYRYTVVVYLEKF